jgi:hypothetical protein
MGKRDTFVTNIKSLTRCNSLRRALQGWTVIRLVHLPRHSAQASCELCGTPFRNGALLVHKANGRTRIAVGGTCLATIQEARFADKRLIKRRKHQVVALLKRRYGNVVDPGAWIAWIVENAPPRLAQIVADLQCFDMVEKDSDLRKLIAFHDKTRLYPAAALIPALANIGPLDVVPAHLTLEQARRLVKSISTERLSAVTVAASSRFFESDFLPRIDADPACVATWRNLPPECRRMVLALARITDRLASGEDLTPLCEVLPLSFPVRTPTFIWHKSLGLGYLDEDEQTLVWPGAKRLWLWGDADYRKHDLHYWESAIPKSPTALLRAETAAFWRAPDWFSV